MEAYTPLADRIRPQSFDEMVGQTLLFGKNGILRRLCEGGVFSNMVFYGPSGTGKTTAANIIAKMSGKPLKKLNATTASLSDIKNVAGETSTVFGSGGILLYLDEIQYFNKKQQQSLLEYIEDGRITLIASTTENPRFYVYGALLSRSTVYEFKPVSADDIRHALFRALDLMNTSLAKNKIFGEGTAEHLASVCGGDVRRGINLLEAAYLAEQSDTITFETAKALCSAASGNYDRCGDEHYDLLSALQKSIRGSDENAALFYLARLLSAGDLISPCRRLLVIASEDIGLAYSQAAVITKACVDSALQLGLPEASIPLSHAVVMLATSPKSNTSCMAYSAAMHDIEAGLGRDFPPHLQNMHADGAEVQVKSGKYLYPHNFPNNYVKQQYLPNDIKNHIYYRFGNNKTEKAAEAYRQFITGAPVQDQEKQHDK